jgi:hypothetical protein
MKNIFILYTFIIASLVFAGCDKDDNDYNEFYHEVIKQWNIPVSASMQNPVAPGRTDTGKLQLELFNDNTLRFDFKDSSLLSGDVITGAHIHSGDPVSNGAIVLDLKPRISGNYISGVIVGLRQSLVDSLINRNVELYFDIHTSRLPSGAARGQLNRNVINSWNISLTGLEEVPPVTTTSTGNAYLRLTSDSILYTKVTVANVEAGDVMNMAHIHTGARGANGPIIVSLVSSAAEFGISKKITITGATITTLLNARTYVNAHSALFPAGKIRGQIRN